MSTNEKIKIQKETLSDLEKELELAVANTNRTLKDITNAEVRKVLDHPKCDIEICDKDGKVIGTVAAGLGCAGLAAAAVGGSIATATAIGGGAFVAGEALSFSVASAAAAAAAPAAAVPGIGWIIAGGILLTAAVTATSIAIANGVDKKKSEDEFNRKQVLFQDKIKELTEELRMKKRKDNDRDDRVRYIEKILCYYEGINPSLA